MTLTTMNLWRIGMLERQIEKFMHMNTDLIAKFVLKFIKYEVEDTGYSLVLRGTIGDSEAFHLEIDDETVKEYLCRLGI